MFIPQASCPCRRSNSCCACSLSCLDHGCLAKRTRFASCPRSRHFHDTARVPVHLDILTFETLLRQNRDDEAICASPVAEAEPNTVVAPVTLARLAVPTPGDTAAHLCAAVQMKTDLLQAVAAGLGFACLEQMLTWGSAGRYLESVFRSNKALPANQVRPAVHQAATNLIGMLHVFIVVPLAVSVLLDPKMIQDRLYSTSSTSNTMLAIASGYFLHDLVVCTIQLKTWGPAYLFHALFCSMLYCYGFFSQVLHYYGAMFLLWELSTPFVYARWFLHKAGMSRTTAYKVNGVLMVLVFFLCRNVAGLVCSIDFFKETAPELRHPSPGGLSPAVIWLYRGLNMALNALNAFWFYKMLTGALKVLRQSPSNTHQAEGHKTDDHKIN